MSNVLLSTSPVNKIKKAVIFMKLGGYGVHGMAQR